MKKINKVLGVIAIAFTGMLLSSCDNKTMSTATTSSSVEQNVEDDIYFGQDRVELEQDTPKFQGFYVEGDDDFNFNNTYIDYHNVQSIKYYCYLTEFNKEVGLHEGVITYYNIKYPITYRVIAKDEIKDKKNYF